jgi:PiT family inorganic phosphate transporter
MACVFGFLMAWGIGANDVSNAMGTSVGSQAITIRQAILIAAVFEFLGSVFSGGEVTQTIRSGILDTSFFIGQPTMLIHSMLASLLASALWLAIACFFGWPVSTTHTIVGAIVGVGMVQFGLDAVHWPGVGNIVLSWLISPLLGCVFAYIVFASVQRFILDNLHPFERAKKIVPIYIFLVGWIISVLALNAALKTFNITLAPFTHFGLPIAFGLGAMLIGRFFLHRIKIDVEADRKFHFTSVEKIFSVLMVFTACAMAYAHGSNDVSNAIGPVAAVVHALEIETTSLHNTAPIPFWVLVLGASGIVVGLLTYGYRVMATIGTKITQLTPSRGFAATLSTAFTVVLASATGYPISTTHTLVGGILGVGLARGIGAINLDVVKSILMSWIITLPAGALLAVLCYKVLLLFF